MLWSWLNQARWSVKSIGPRSEYKPRLKLTLSGLILIVPDRKKQTAADHLYSDQVTEIVSRHNSERVKMIFNILELPREIFRVDITKML